VHDVWDHSRHTSTVTGSHEREGPCVVRVGSSVSAMCSKGTPLVRCPQRHTSSACAPSPCAQPCGTVHDTRSQQSDLVVWDALRLSAWRIRSGQAYFGRHRPSAACSSASAKSAAAVALQLLMMLDANASALETRSLVKSTTDAHSQAIPGLVNAMSTFEASSSCRLATASVGIRTLSPSLTAAVMVLRSDGPIGAAVGDRPR
jgi:hypothetical protein